MGTLQNPTPRIKAITANPTLVPKLSEPRREALRKLGLGRTGAVVTPVLAVSVGQTQHGDVRAGTRLSHVVGQRVHDVQQQLARQAPDVGQGRHLVGVTEIIFKNTGNYLTL